MILRSTIPAAMLIMQRNRRRSGRSRRCLSATNENPATCEPWMSTSGLWSVFRDGELPYSQNVSQTGFLQRADDCGSKGTFRVCDFFSEVRVGLLLIGTQCLRRSLCSIPLDFVTWLNGLKQHRGPGAIPLQNERVAS